MKFAVLVVFRGGVGETILQPASVSVARSEFKRIVADPPADVDEVHYLGSDGETRKKNLAPRAWNFQGATQCTRLKPVKKRSAKATSDDEDANETDAEPVDPLRNIPLSEIRNGLTRHHKERGGLPGQTAPAQPPKRTEKPQEPGRNIPLSELRKAADRVQSDNIPPVAPLALPAPSEKKTDGVSETPHVPDTAPPPSLPLSPLNDLPPEETDETESESQEAPAPDPQ